MDAPLTGVGAQQAHPSNHKPDHSAVSAAIYANAATAVTIAYLKQRWNVDLTDQASNIAILVTGVGYITPWLTRRFFSKLG